MHRHRFEFNYAPGGDNYLQNQRKFFANGMKELARILPEPALTSYSRARGPGVECDPENEPEACIVAAATLVDAMS